MVTPLLMLVLLGVIDVSYALLDQHVVTRLTREGANLISRDTTIEDAATAMQNMATSPVNFSSNSTLIFSVLHKGATVGSANYNKTFVYQRYQFGAIAATSDIRTRGGGSFAGAPEYQATNPDGDTSLQVTNLPPNLTIDTGGFVYVTEIFTKHELLTPLDRLGVPVPSMLYSIAYF